VFDFWRTATVYADASRATGCVRAQWQARQAQRLQALLAAAAQGSRWWHARLGDAAAPSDAPALQRLARVPVSRKGELMARFADWVTDPALDLDALRAFAQGGGASADEFLGRWTVWESSGSSGEPALFVQDAQAMAVADALEAVRGPIALGVGVGVGGAGFNTGFGAWGPRLALVGAIDGPFASIVSLQRLRRLNPWLAASARPFSFLRPIAALVDELNTWRPSVIATYPSMAWMLAQEQRAGRLRLSLQALWTGGETLTPTVRALLAETFGCAVRNSYGASECLTIANECRLGAMHVNADWTVLEAVDERGRAVPAGVVGQTTLLTNLANHAQPIIRYDLGDRVRFAREPCACGNSMPVIDVEGRCDDVLTLDDGHRRSVHLAPLALTTVLEDEAGVFDFQLCQCGTRALRLDLFGSDGARRGSGQRARGALSQFLSEHGLPAAKLEVHCTAAACSRGRTGKQRRVLNREHAAAARHE
jgi:phenylacetate-CoA ligase